MQVFGNASNDIKQRTLKLY